MSDHGNKQFVGEWEAKGLFVLSSTGQLPESAGEIVLKTFALDSPKP